MGVVKTVRLEKVTYPDGREVHYDYGTAGAIDDIMSRLASIKDDDGSTVLASYKYLGANRIVTEDYEEIEVNLDYTGTNNDFSKLDRFGRVADQVWNDYGATPDVVLDRYTYTYDRVGNRTSRDNELHAAFDEDYTYDALYRLTGVDRADAFDQSWDLDGLGNWGTFDDDGTSQTRTANEANEITAITGGWITPAYDAAGNMISGPKPGDETTRVHYIYDAWNRLTEVRADDSGNPGDLIATYSYDGLNRRIEKQVTAGSVDTHYYYNDDWQCVEVSDQLPADADVQYVWGAKYVDDLILRDRDTDANGTMDERLYALADANYNVTALVDATGDVAERYLYTPYGTVTVLDPDFSPDADGKSDYDNTTLYTGREFDAETALMYYRARYYHSELGRFVARDPIGYLGSEWNLYEYVAGAPTTGLDPTGQQCERILPDGDAPISTAGRLLQFVPVFYTFWFFYSCSSFLDVYDPLQEACVQEYNDDPVGFAFEYADHPNVMPIFHRKSLEGMLLSCIAEKARAELTPDQLADFEKGFQKCIEAIRGAMTLALRQLK